MNCQPKDTAGRIIYTELVDDIWGVTGISRSDYLRTNACLCPGAGFAPICPNPLEGHQAVNAD